MTFIDLVRREMHSSLPRLLFMAGLSGICNAALLTAINNAAQKAGDSNNPDLWAACLFVVALFLFFKTQNYILITAAVEIESIIDKLRLRLLDAVRHSELAAMESIGRARIVASITSDAAVLAQAVPQFVFSLQSLGLIVFVGLYVAYLSFVVFLVSISIVALTAAISFFQGRQLAEGQREAGEWANQLFDRLTDMLDGFKEVRLNKLRSDKLMDDFLEVSSAAAYAKIKTDADNAKRMIFSQIAMFLLLGTVVFVAPQLTEAGSSAISKVILDLLFVVGSSFVLVQSIPMMAAANASADRIANLEADLLATARSVDIDPSEMPQTFETIEFRDVVFRYFDRDSEMTFKVGPVDFTLHRGDLVFITGGNGSGKSTFMKLLSGLYMPESGTITLDGMTIDDNTREKYRALITAIFSDYHLFRRPYGIDRVDHAEVEQMLSRFHLATKTQLTEDGFRTLDLSAGQRKRLALVVGLLEKRPILLLDEWASDQDPDFRRKFYNELLPDLKKSGVTIVAVSHDDRYLNELDYAACKLHMEEGRFSA